MYVHIEKNYFRVSLFHLDHEFLAHERSEQAGIIWGHKTQATVLAQALPCKEQIAVGDVLTVCSLGLQGGTGVPLPVQCSGAGGSLPAH